MVNRHAQHLIWQVVAWTGAAVLPDTIGYWRYTSGKSRKNQRTETA